MDISNDGNDNIAIVWKDPRNSDSDIYAQLLNSAGVPQWNPNGTAICTFTENQENPQVCSSSQGTIFAWEDLRPVTYYDIYAYGIIQQEQTNPIPGFNLVFAVLGFTALILVAQRKKKH